MFTRASGLLRQTSERVRAASASEARHPLVLRTALRNEPPEAVILLWFNDVRPKHSHVRLERLISEAKTSAHHQQTSDIKHPTSAHGSSCSALSRH